MAARERALRQAEDRMAKAHERLVVWFSTNRKAVLEDLAYLEEKGRYQELHDRAGLFESLNDSEVQRYRQKAAENLQQVVSGNATVAGTGTAVANQGEGEAGRAGTTDGFELAEADLRLRKEGDVLGAGQSGTATHLRFLSVRRDEALIRAAKDEAEALLAEDPTLRSHPDLARALRQASDGQLEWMQRS